MPAMPNTQTMRMPAMKNSALHTSTTSMVWPKSGWMTSSVTTIKSNTSEKKFAGMSGRFEDSPNSQATRMTKAGLRNSDGWMLTPRMISQRLAPLISAPNTGVSATRIRLTMKTRSESLRIWCGLRKETPMRTISVGTRNRMCRLTK